MDNKDSVELFTRTKEVFDQNQVVKEKITQTVFAPRETLELISDLKLGPEEFINYLSQMMDDLD